MADLAHNPFAFVLFGENPAEIGVVSRIPEDKREKARGQRRKEATWEIKGAKFIRPKWDLGSRSVRVWYRLGSVVQRTLLELGSPGFGSVGREKRGQIGRLYLIHHAAAHFAPKKNGRDATQRQTTGSWVVGLPMRICVVIRWDLGSMRLRQ